MINIVLADDHQVVRQGFRALLETEPDFHVIGEASDGAEAIQLVKSLQPDILVADLMMNGINGIEVTRQVGKSSPGTAVVILSMYDSEGYVLEALRAGARAYVLKGSKADELLCAIREAAAGHRYLSRPISDRAIEAYTQKAESTELNPYDTLTAREVVVLHLSAQGCTNAEIASQLCISRRTVEVHRANMMHKLHLHTQSELFLYAIQQGLLKTST